MTIQPRGLTTRRALATDLHLVRRTLYDAVTWSMNDPLPSLESIVDSPTKSIYQEGWMRDGDAGVIGEVDGQFVGMAYYRLLAPDSGAQAWLDDRTPEMVMSVDAEHRAKGIGTALLTALHDVAIGDGLSRLSLSVVPTNPARRLYDRLGYRTVRPHDGWLVMVVDLEVRRTEVHASPA